MDFTPRNAAKYVAKAAVHFNVAGITKGTIVNHTRFEEDDFTVEITGHVAGWYVSEKLKPYTDAIVDKAADWLVARKAAKTQNETTE